MSAPRQPGLWNFVKHLLGVTTNTNNQTNTPETMETNNIKQTVVASNYKEELKALAQKQHDDRAFYRNPENNGYQRSCKQSECFYRTSKLREMHTIWYAIKHRIKDEDIPDYFVKNGYEGTWIIDRFIKAREGHEEAIRLDKQQA